LTTPPPRDEGGGDAAVVADEVVADEDAGVEAGGGEEAAAPGDIARGGDVIGRDPSPPIGTAPGGSLRPVDDTGPRDALLAGPTSTDSVVGDVVTGGEATAEAVAVAAAAAAEAAAGPGDFTRTSSETGFFAAGGGDCTFGSGGWLSV